MMTQKSTKPQWLLYMKPSCPYCQKVLHFVDGSGITVPTVDISSDANAKQTLLTIGGKTQVPCLFVDGKPLYESADIIAHLKDHIP